jgi:hypothetical protein
MDRYERLMRTLDSMDLWLPDRQPRLCSRKDVHSYFKIMEELGQGGFGSVYKAKVLPLAIKELPEFQVPDPSP